jgi:predicted short-subunit dehydrogenase-like oxidoreductase (DUF2520 family)
VGVSNSASDYEGRDRIGFIGAGAVGTALPFRLSEKGYPVSAVFSRTWSSARRLARLFTNCRLCRSHQEVADLSDCVFITTSDDVIPTVAQAVHWRPGQKVIHCSGADSLDVLEKARGDGALTGCLHPLQTFANLEQAKQNLPGSTFGLEADAGLLPFLEELTEALECNCVVLKSGEKVLYHAAAVLSCNYVITLLKLSTDLWKTFGVSRDQAVEALLPLLRGTLRNIENIGLPDCLTGPIARGDLGTVKKHLRALDKVDPGLARVYSELARQTVPISLRKGGIGERKADEIRCFLERWDEGERD